MARKFDDSLRARPRARRERATMDELQLLRSVSLRQDAKLRKLTAALKTIELALRKADCRCVYLGEGCISQCVRCEALEIVHQLENPNDPQVHKSK